jgi:hypothetical protein
MTRAHRTFLLWVLLLLARPALAGNDGFGVIRGTVLSSQDWGTLEGVQVILRSPSLYKGELRTVTDKNGSYWFPQLPPGPYVLSFDFESYVPCIREAVVRLNQTHRLNVELWRTSLSDHDCSEHCLNPWVTLPTVNRPSQDSRPKPEDAPREPPPPSRRRELPPLWVPPQWRDVPNRVPPPERPGPERVQEGLPHRSRGLQRGQGLG